MMCLWLLPLLCVDHYLLPEILRERCWCAKMLTSIPLISPMVHYTVSYSSLPWEFSRTFLSKSVFGYIYSSSWSIHCLYFWDHTALLEKMLDYVNIALMPTLKAWYIPIAVLSSWTENTTHWVKSQRNILEVLKKLFPSYLEVEDDVFKL